MAADQVLQGQCSAVVDLTQLVQLAQEMRFAVTARELQLWAHYEAFASPWWQGAAHRFLPRGALRFDVRKLVIAMSHSCLIKATGRR